MKHKRTKVGERILAYAVLIVLSFLCLFFFYILLVNASRSHAELQRGFSWLPGDYFLENLKAVATDGNFPMFKGILNSLIVSSCSAALCTYFSALTAYGLYAYNFKFKKLAFTFIMAILVMPTQVTAMGFLRLMTNMGLYDTLWPLILPSIASPAVFYFMYSYLKSSLPLSLVEAARIDGASPIQIMLKVYLPVSLPALATVALFAIVNHWNDYFNGLIYMSKAEMYPLQTYIQQLTVDLTQITDANQLKQLSSMNNRTFNAAKIVVSTIPLLVIYPFLQKYFVSGIVIGAVKE